MKIHRLLSFADRIYFDKILVSEYKIVKVIKNAIFFFSEWVNLEEKYREITESGRKNKTQITLKKKGNGQLLIEFQQHCFQRKTIKKWREINKQHCTKYRKSKTDEKEKTRNPSDETVVSNNDLQK
jgi:hypothetical protein